MKNQPQTTEELCKNTGRSYKAVYYDRRRFLIEEKVIKDLQDRWELWNYDPLEEKVGKALEEIRKIFDIQYPPLKYIAYHPDVRKPPQKIFEILYTLDWRKPSEEEELAFQINFKTRAESAWQLKHEPEKLRVHEDYRKKIERFLERYPNEIQNPGARAL